MTVVSWYNVCFGWSYVLKRLTEDINMLHAVVLTRLMDLHFRLLSCCLVSLPLEEFWKLLSICHYFKSGLDCYSDVGVQMHL